LREELLGIGCGTRGLRLIVQHHDPYLLAVDAAPRVDVVEISLHRLDHRGVVGRDRAGHGCGHADEISILRTRRGQRRERREQRQP
jgi:hypothetical protein